MEKWQKEKKEKKEQSVSTNLLLPKLIWWGGDGESHKIFKFYGAVGAKKSKIFDAISCNFQP